MFRFEEGGGERERERRGRKKKKKKKKKKRLRRGAFFPSFFLSFFVSFFLTFFLCCSFFLSFFFRFRGLVRSARLPKSVSMPARLPLHPRQSNFRRQPSSRRQLGDALFRFSVLNKKRKRGGRKGREVSLSRVFLLSFAPGLPAVPLLYSLFDWQGGVLPSVLAASELCCFTGSWEAALRTFFFFSFEKKNH